MPDTPRPPQVRLALPAEAAAIAALQRRCWDADLPEDLRGWLLTEADLGDLTEVWYGAVTAPPEARCRVLVAIAGTEDGGAPGATPPIVGFVTTEPASDPDSDPSQDGELGEWLVDPAARSQGHGSRLLNAAVDTLRADGFRRATIWVASTDDGRRKLLTGAGWAADGGHRELGPERDVTLKQVRLHSDITED